MYIYITYFDLPFICILGTSNNYISIICQYNYVQGPPTSFCIFRNFLALNIIPFLKGSLEILLIYKNHNVTFLQLFIQCMIYMRNSSVYFFQIYHELNNRQTLKHMYAFFRLMFSVYSNGNRQLKDVLRPIMIFGFNLHKYIIVYMYV